MNAVGPEWHTAGMQVPVYGSVRSYDLLTVLQPWSTAPVWPWLCSACNLP